MVSLVVLILVLVAVVFLTLQIGNAEISGVTIAQILLNKLGLGISSADWTQPWKQL